MAVGPTLLPIFQQLGIYDEFLPLGKRIVYTPFYKESLESYRPTDHIAIEELYVSSHLFTCYTIHFNALSV